VRDQPGPIGDPYRELGLEPGASMADVKRAYRRLAKAFHPDSAGEAALPRFLAIHEAYERLVTGRSRAGAGPRTAQHTPAAEPWRADPERARAARERARTGRASTGTRAQAGGTAGTHSRSGTSGSPAGPGGAKGSKGSGPGSREGRRRNVRKATLGSTSYDEARDATDATWSGASWYGPSSGEYWIVNPREYADPRKHGPGYQQRARSAAAARQAGTGTTGTVEPGEEIDTDAAGEQPIAEGTTVGSSATRGWSADRARERDARRWAAQSQPGWSAAPADLGRVGSRSQRDAGGGLPGDGRPRDPIESLGATGRDLLGGPTDDPIRRLGLALVAWPPLGLASAAAIGDITGCTSYSAACGGSDAILPWLAQAVILGLLLLLPPLARLFVGGTIGVLLALVPVTAFLLVVGAGGAPQSAFVLGALLAAAWIGGVAFAARGATRRAAGPGG
jgi:curved DNA-binding protein CbpA